MKNLLTIVLTIWATLAAAEPAMAPAPDHSGDAEPISLTATGPASCTAGTEVAIRVRVARHWGTSGPVPVKVELPEGTQLLSGATEWEIPPGGPTVDERVLRLRLDSIPAGDLIARVSYREPAFGVTATAYYRFGRPAPTVPPLQRGPRVRLITGEDLGRPVMLDRAGSPKRRVEGP